MNEQERRDVVDFGLSDISILEVFEVCSLKNIKMQTHQFLIFFISQSRFKFSCSRSIKTLKHNKDVHKNSVFINWWTSLRLARNYLADDFNQDLVQE